MYICIYLYIRYAVTYTLRYLEMLVPGWGVLEISLLSLEGQTKVRVDIMQPYRIMKCVYVRNSS